MAGVSANRSAMTRVRIAACLALLVVFSGRAAVSPARAQALEHTVGVHSNFYDPRVIYIAPGDTVVWNAIAGGHTVTADDGRFDFFPTRTLDRGSSVRWTFVAEETVAYHCRVHGATGGRGMSGLVVVGSGGPAPTPSPSQPPSPPRVVPSDYPSIGAALDGVPPGSVVAVRPGVYNESVTVSVPGVTIRGLGAGPDEVVLDGASQLTTGVRAVADGVRVDNLTVRRYRDTGIAVQGSVGFRIARVVADGNGTSGVSVTSARGGTIEDSTLSGSRLAGLFIRQCPDCDVRAERLAARASLYGIYVSNAGGVVVRDSDVAANGSGIVLRSSAGSPNLPQQGVHVYGNRITGNDALVPPAPSGEFAVAAGVWLAGGVQDVVESNVVTGQDHGVLVAGGVAAQDVVRDNVVSGNRRADLAWDGLGADTCFSANRTAEGREPRAWPELAQTIYSCSLPLTVGIPEYRALADLAMYAAGLRP